MKLKEYIQTILPLIKAVRKLEQDESHAAKHVRYLYGQLFYGFDDFAKKKSIKCSKEALQIKRAYQQIVGAIYP